jgi:misacylated tRNA(Ala) deacylase
MWTPPRTVGRIRHRRIEGLDFQACGGTHVRSRPNRGRVRIARIETKGRQNRRFSGV